MSIQTNIDVLSDALRSIRLEGSIFFNSTMHSPWAINKPAGTNPIFHIALNGSCYFQSQTMAQPVRLEDGDVILLCDGSQHWLGDSPENDRIDTESPCIPLEQSNAMPKSTANVLLLCGQLNFSGGIIHPLIGTLPSYVHIRRGDSEHHRWLANTVALLENEMRAGAPGTGIMSDRLCEMVFIQTLRVFSTEHPDGFLAAMNDPQVRTSLEIIHSRYQSPWTIDALAKEVYLSRSALARRFNHLIGVPPIAYLTSWRMYKALDILRISQDKPIEQIAIDVGYSSAEAFDKAFKRYFGKSPGMARKAREPDNYSPLIRNPQQYTL